MDTCPEDEDQRVLNSSAMQHALLMATSETVNNSGRSSRKASKDNSAALHTALYEYIVTNMQKVDLQRWLLRTIPDLHDERPKSQRFLELSQNNVLNFFKYYQILYSSPKDPRKAKDFTEEIKQANHTVALRMADMSNLPVDAIASSSKGPRGRTKRSGVQVKRESVGPDSQHISTGKKRRTSTTATHTAKEENVASSRLKRKKVQNAKKKKKGVMKLEPEVGTFNISDDAPLSVSGSQDKHSDEPGSYIVVQRRRSTPRPSRAMPSQVVTISDVDTGNTEEKSIRPPSVLAPAPAAHEREATPTEQSLSTPSSLYGHSGASVFAASVYETKPAEYHQAHPGNMTQDRLLDFLSLTSWMAAWCIIDHTSPEEVNISAPKVESNTEVTSLDIPQAPVLPTYDTRPPLLRDPPIWAQTRQEVCESFEFFKSYQGGVYFSDNVVKGYLLSAFPAKRDTFEHDGKLIISHGGGGSSSGQTQIETDSDQLTGDKSVRALLNNYRNQIPLVLLIDERYSKFPYSLASRGIIYAVLGLYVITRAWAESQPAPGSPNERVVRWKFAFQWYSHQEEPWWIRMSERPDTAATQESGDCTNVLDNGFVVNDHDQHTAILRANSCSQCTQQSLMVYQQAWLCLNPECHWFWRDVQGNLCKTQELTYDPSFLQLAVIPDCKLPARYTNLRPPPPAPASDARVSSVYEFSRGWHCPKCGRLTCRFKWQHWECANCKNVYPVQHTTRSEKDLRGIQLRFNGLPGSVARIGPISRIVSPQMEVLLAEGKVVAYVQSYILPEGRGKIHHIIAKPFNKVSKEADEIFKEYQEQAATGAIAFKRWPLRAHKLRTPLLTNYFSQNCGEPYQYVGGSANTVPFSEAPSAVVRARAYMEELVNKVLQQPGYTFNEVLSAAYMERQKMAFHSDAERGLGPVVAGVSFGSPAFMHFRLLKRYIPEGGSRDNALSLILKHGDILVMEGNDVQKYYEHCVAPANFRISATGRYIDPSSATAPSFKTDYAETAQPPFNQG